MWAFVFCVLFVGCGSYNQIMQKKLKALLGDDFKKYTWFSYPTDNFGLATCYSTPAEVVQLNLDTSYLCATYTCLHIEPSKNPVETDRLKENMSLNGLADVGNQGAAIDLTEKEKSEIGIKLLLPSIYQMISLDASANYKKQLNTTIYLGRAYPRKLNFHFLEYVAKLDDSNPLKQAFRNNTLSLAVADLVIDSLSVTITLTREADATLKAKLDNAVGKALGTGAALEVTGNKQAEGVYRFTTTKPTIVAALYARKPSGRVPAAAGFDNWPKIKTIEPAQ